MARKFISYTRFSGKSQEAGDSQRRQDALAERAAKEEGLPIDTTITLDDKAISAFRGANWHRGKLGKFIDLVDSGIVPRGSVLCIERVNRMSRLPWMQQVELWKEILSRGIVIRTCEPPSRYTEKNMNDLAIGCPVVIYMMLGHAESKQKSDWSFEAFDEMKRQCREHGKPHNLAVPEWIIRVTVPNPKDPERRITIGYDIDPQRKHLIQWMHERAQTYGWGSRRIRRELNESGIPPWNGKRWAESTITNLLTSRTTVGEYQPSRINDDGVRVPDGPPIKLYPEAIDEDCWRRTQAARRKRTRSGGRHSLTANNLFTHLVKDASAGEPLHIRSGGDYVYLTTPEHPWTIPYGAFEHAMRCAIGDLLPADVDGRHQANALTAQVELVQQQRCQLGLDRDALVQQFRELPSDRWPKGGVALWSDLDAAIAAKDEELRLLKERADTSTRTEALIAVQSYFDRLDELERNGPREAIAPLREKIKGRIPFVIESIWVRVETQNCYRRWVHGRIYLQGGEQRPFLIAVNKPTTAPLNLSHADFLAGDERGYVAGPRRRHKGQTPTPAI